MDRWGIVDLFVWSRESVAYLAADSRYRQVWSDNHWTQFRRDGADAREVTVPHGTCDVALVYPSHTGLRVLALFASIVGMLVLVARARDPG